MKIFGIPTCYNEKLHRHDGAILKFTGSGYSANAEMPSMVTSAPAIFFTSP